MPFGIKFGVGGIPEEREKEEEVFGGEAEELLEERAARRPTYDVPFVPVRVSDFDKLIEKGGVEKGTNFLLSGGCGTGKSTFAMQSIYNGLLAGEKAVYILFEESDEKIKRHMRVNFGWDLEKFEKLDRLAILRINPFKIARSVEASLVKQRRALLIQVEQLELPFVPDKIVVDSLSALSVAFMGNTENYRYYIKHMFDSLNQYDSINFIISETEQDPGIYSRTGIEEFLADGVIVLYNVKVGMTRKRMLEILKLRCSNHVKTLVPYNITPKGIAIEYDASKTALEEIGVRK
ncbi:MAG: ATPase domain-containing protein [Candidatus Diapherotrites archaeon]